MYTWYVKSYPEKYMSRYQAYKKRLDILYMKRPKQLILVSAGLMGYQKYLHYVEFGDLIGYFK